MERLAVVKIPTFCDLMPSRSRYTIDTPLGRYVDIQTLVQAYEELGRRLVRLYVSVHGPCRILRILSEIEKFEDLCVEASFAEAAEKILTDPEAGARYAAAVAALGYALKGTAELVSLLGRRRTI
ncbi:MAG: hypothetical protein ACP5I3_10265 [Thermoproteus sp.]